MWLLVFHGVDAMGSADRIAQVKCAQCWGAGNFSLMRSRSAAGMRPRSRLGGAKSACA
jgi:hypothetical protein